MKRILVTLVAVLTVSCATTQAQFRIGIKAGANISRLSFSGDQPIEVSPIASFTGGLMAEAIIPTIGLGLDVSALYVQQGAKVRSEVPGTLDQKTDDLKLHYIDVPLNLKYKIGIKGLKIFATAGPNFSFCLSNMPNGLQLDHRVDIGLNLGAGIELFERVQVGIQHTWAFGQGLYYDLGSIRDSASSRSYMITLAVLF